MDSDEDIMYSSGDDGGDDYYYGDCDNGDMPFDVDTDMASDDHKEKHYTVLRETDIRRLLEDDITLVSSILSISMVEAGRLLLHYKWNVTLVHDEWFAHEERVRRTVGLLSMPTVRLPDVKELVCRICFDTYSVDELVAASCGHLFCVKCWEGYIHTSISDGFGCLFLRCPGPSCNAAIGEDMVNQLVSDEDRKKYFQYFVRSYIEDKKKTKWCPAPGCNYAVECDLDISVYDVTCLCSYRFCWKCTEEAHRPVDCSTVRKWILKNNDESENMNWILANSKPCPKCKRPIEKNHGCMHMTCTPPCNFQFCWLCLGAWSEHSARSRTGGSNACNGYEAAKKDGLFDEAEKRRETAKKSIEKYTHFYIRWASNQLSKQKAQADLHQMRTVTLVKLSDKYMEPVIQFQFILEAWKQVIECRGVLKWSYAYGYYLPENEPAKKQFFEYLQGEAENNLERLHQCAEKELQLYLVDKKEAEFNKFRSKLVGLTSVTRSYFEKLVRALENGLSDVCSEITCSKSAS